VTGAGTNDYSANIHNDDAVNDNTDIIKKISHYSHPLDIYLSLTSVLTLSYIPWLFRGLLRVDNGESGELASLFFETDGFFSRDLGV